MEKLQQLGPHFVPAEVNIRRELTGGSLAAFRFRLKIATKYGFLIAGYFCFNARV